MPPGAPTTPRCARASGSAWRRPSSPRPATPTGGGASRRRPCGECSRWPASNCSSSPTARSTVRRSAAPRASRSNLWHMATAREHRTIAPVVGPDDPRRFTDSGVEIDSIEDMRTAFDGIPLDEVSTSMTINAPASVLMLLYQLVGEEQGVSSEQLRGTTQNDILKEYIARGNFIYPPPGSMRLTTDLFAYCLQNIPRWTTISISGYHFREQGASAVQEVAFTLANGIAYVQAAIDAGLAVDDFAPRLAFFFNGHNNVFQEVAKFRAARTMWARIMRERFGAQDE